MSLKTMRKKRWSLVRFLASCVPGFLWEYVFPVPPRMFINSSFIQTISALKENNFPSDDSNTSFSSFKQNFCSKKQHVIFNSTPKKAEDVKEDKLKALQEELNEIKKIVSKLMEKQTEQCSDYGTLTAPSEQLLKCSAPVPHSVPVPPPLPPPPPPLPPNFSLIPINTPLKITKKKIINPVPGFPCGKELLKDLKKVKLKKIEKSPGGGPLKKPKSISDPGNFLAAILKQRYGCVQSSPDSSHESVSIENSFSSSNINNGYAVEKNPKITVV